jgi:predicted DNA-binding transcriptional regulator YafY
MTTSARLLRLLGLLQARPAWGGDELAARLDVTTRTVRNDVERLRALGYPVDATPGRGGGYRLGPGATLPPLLLDDDEAVAVAVGLRAAAGGDIAGAEESSLRALVKLEQVLPARLRHRVRAVHAAVDQPVGRGPGLDAEVLTWLAAAVRDHERVRFDYASHGGGASVRLVEPQRLVHTRGRWYLLAWDVDRDAWRTFRADRLILRATTGPRFPARADPPGGAAAFVGRGLETAPWAFRATVTVAAPAARVADRVPASVAVEPLDGDTCRVRVGADSPAVLARWLTQLDAEITVDDPALAAALAALSDRLGRAAAGA